MTSVGQPTATPPLRHRWLYALPNGRLPDSVACAGDVYTRVETFKHDFFAATGRYRGPHGDAVLKVGRVTPLFGVPMRWAGRFLCRREVRLYELVEDLPGVPELIGQVGDTGFLHAFVPGRPLGRRDAVSDTFFDELEALLAALHDRHIAYVDLNKRQNILLGEDHRPYLIDFQISLHIPPRRWGRFALARWLLRIFQRSDRYHLLKHKRRLRPDRLTDAERRDTERISLWIRLHRLVARPLTALRRRILGWLRRGDDSRVAGSSAK